MLLTTKKELSRQWRAYGLEQQALLNCRQLWTRQVEKNRRDVEEAVEKLKVLAQLGALTAGFAVSAFYDFQYTASPSDPVIPFFGLVTALTVGFELNSCVLCTLMLSSVVKAGKRYTSEEEEAEYLWRMRDWAAAASAGVPGSVPPAPRRSFERHWESRCESRWRTALAMFLAGIPTFFAVMGLAGYLKYWNSPATVVITAVLMAAAFVYTVGMSADWAKSLLGRRSAGGEDTLGWQGAWWSSPELSQRLPFAYHQVPHKDVCWPPPSSTAAAAAAASAASTAGDEHEGQRAGQGAGAATTAAPYLARTLDELPYPAIIGLQPWPTELALGTVPAAAGAHARAHVMAAEEAEATGRAPPAPEAVAAQQMPGPDPQPWPQAAALGDGAVEAGHAAAAADVGPAAAAGVGPAAGSVGAWAAGAELRLGPGSRVGGGSCAAGSVGGSAAMWADTGRHGNSADEEVQVQAARHGMSAVGSSPGRAAGSGSELLPAGRHSLQLQAAAAPVRLRRTPSPSGEAACPGCGADAGGPSGRTAPQATMKGLQGFMRVLGSACGSAPEPGGGTGGGGGTGTGSGSSYGAGGGGAAGGQRQQLASNSVDAAAGSAGGARVHVNSCAAPTIQPAASDSDSWSADASAAHCIAEGAASARVTSESLHSCGSMPESNVDEDRRGGGS
ncbi:hypothetical protein HXX76_003362 [Chlamydomonas incerta]|uniref:Uncharacterized protein n=1 Tax=Chlamydomonas incerta TaxID=51695 RepID=A0A835W5W1_CHLIN|nr:hypothetical protein HXX76_003362 [Chlamydomonas incerta]|eukprot:KAG2441747.1 hypothetical protein HXX76_003362 [Chlamydomonas incerta]